MAREIEQEMEWREAQMIKVNVDLVAAAKQQLLFLATVDRNRWLYEGPGLDRAIYRYNAFWLPLLAKHSEAPLFEGPLVVPLDCEWVWHCHRLNPVRYKTDCEELYGKILDNRNVVSSIQGTFKRDTEEVWKKLYPGEPYELDPAAAFEGNMSEKMAGVERCTKYDLISAVQRQSPFFYQVSRPHMDNDLYLEGAEARYKGFLHLIKRNKERSIKSFSVPTYDIDLVWHTHQLHPVSYCNDLLEIMGKVLEHDDTDSDRTKGKKLDTGFSGTTKNWEEMYGSRYWRAGAMYKGATPSPVQSNPYPFSALNKKVIVSDEDQKIMHISESKVIEVMLEFVSVKNLANGHKGSLFVSFSKTQPDAIFNAKRRLTILSESGVKQVACFHCQPTGDLLFELMIRSPSNNPLSKPVKTLGSGSISLGDLMLPKSGLAMEKWLDLMPGPNVKNSEPISLRVAISVTLPTPAPYVLHMVRNRPFSKNSCFFPLSGKVQSARNWTRVIDEDGAEAISLQMRDCKKSKGERESSVKKEVIGILNSGETCALAECVGTEWSFRSCQWSLQLQKSTDKNDHLLELTGHHTVKFYPGRRLEYEAKHSCEKWGKEQGFVTAVEFSVEDPYGKAVALLDLNSGIIKVKESWMLLPATVLAYILGDVVRKEGYHTRLSTVNNVKDNEGPIQEVNSGNEVGLKIHPTSAVEKEVDLDHDVDKQIVVAAKKGGACGGGCGAGCGSSMRSGASSEIKSGGCGGCGAGCGSGCGGGCGSMVKSGASGGCGAGCGGGCGGGCGSMVKSGSCGGCGAGCGGGCGGGCGSMIKSGACGGCGAGGCGSMINSGGCGGCGAGGCGSMINSGSCGGCGAGGCGSMINSGSCGGCGAGGCGDGFSKATSEINHGVSVSVN